MINVNTSIIIITICCLIVLFRYICKYSICNIKTDYTRKNVAILPGLRGITITITKQNDMTDNIYFNIWWIRNTYGFTSSRCVNRYPAGQKAKCNKLGSDWFLAASKRPGTNHCPVCCRLAVFVLSVSSLTGRVYISLSLITFWPQQMTTELLD